MIIATTMTGTIMTMKITMSIATVTTAIILFELAMEEVVGDCDITRVVNGPTSTAVLIKNGALFKF